MQSCTMKGLAVIFLAQVAFSHPFVLREPVPECGAGSPTYLPHPTDCDKYYICEDGEAMLQQCKPGLWWNGAFEMCDLPEMVDCSPPDVSKTAPERTAAPPTCGPDSPTHIAHPTDCTKYYTCTNGEAIVQECAPGLWWSEAIEGCDLPENVECAADGSSTAAPTTPPATTVPPPTCGPDSPTHIAHPTDCAKYYTCTNGEAIVQECAPGLWWSEAIEGCDLPENVECAANGSKPPTEPTTPTIVPTTAPTTPALPLCGPGSPTHVPHPSDCSKYYTCDEGEAILQDCPPGLWWNVAVESCDFPENVECAAAGSTSPPPNTTTAAAPPTE